MTDPRERVVVTGMGAVSPLGHTVESSIDALMQGADGIVSIDDDVLKGYPQLRVHTGARVQEFSLQHDPELAALINQKDERRLHTSAQYALWASAEALRQAGVQLPAGKEAHTFFRDAGIDADRVGVSIGTGVGGANIVGDARIRLDQGKRLVPNTLFQMLPERVATTTSMTYKARGPVKEVAAACATGNANIIEGARLLRLGEADMVITGGAEAQISVEAIGLFDGTTALDTTADPRQASRPFHSEANGFVMGEGAGVLVLETLTHARRRGAFILAELIGYGETGDAYHDTTPSGEGAPRALQLALGKHALRRGIYINAHATGTAGDAIELQAIGKVLEPGQVAGISSTKGATAHMLGAAGAFEAIVSIEAMRRGMVPPSLKLDKPIVETQGWPMAEFTATKQDIDMVVNNSFGFGGLNAVTVFGRAD